MPPSKPRTAAPKCARCGHAKPKHTRRMGCAVRTGRDSYCSCLKYMPDSAAILAEAEALAEIDAMPDDMPARVEPSDRARAARDAWVAGQGGQDRIMRRIAGGGPLDAYTAAAERYEDG